MLSAWALDLCILDKNDYSGGTAEAQVIFEKQEINFLLSLVIP